MTRVKEKNFIQKLNLKEKEEFRKSRERMVETQMQARDISDPRVLDAMQPYFDQFFGNPSSIHTFGQQAERALEESRLKVANHLN